MEEPPLVPEYDKPDSPGIWMNFDNTVSIYNVVAADDAFEDAARDVFAMMREAQERFPDWPRVLYLDIEGHRGDASGFDPDFFEFQQEFMIGALGPYLTALAMPLVSVVNPEEQKNDLPDQLAIQHDESESESRGDGESETG
jgi:hypothetical protein